VAGSGRLVVAVLDRFPKELEPMIRSGSRPDWELVFATERDAADSRALVRTADAIWAGATPTTAGILSAGPSIAFLQKLGAGVDNVDMEACRSRGAAVARLANVNGETVAEHAIMLILSLYRRLPSIDRRVRSGEWFKEEVRSVHRELRGKTVGIVGMGSSGRAMAKRVNAFGARVIYAAPRRASPEIEAALELTHVSLDELVAAADIVSLHLPLKPDTRNLIDADRIGRMKPDAILINCARGGLVDEAALEASLRANRILGAGLDCFAEEPPGQSPLLLLPNTIVTPHIAGTTLDNFANVVRRAASNTQAFFSGQPLPADDIVYLPPGTPKMGSDNSNNSSARQREVNNTAA
jgi:D-3-phosphoglycerate dehydrogenase / 2-oxoglutarate reductase